MAANLDLLERLHLGNSEASRPLENIYKAVDQLIARVNAGDGGHPLPMGMYWSWTEGMPTSDAVMLRPVVTASGKVTQVMAAVEVMSTPGFVTSIQGFSNGDPGGSWTLSLYKNGRPTGLFANSSSNTLLGMAPAKKYAYEQNDRLAVYIRGASATMNQSFSAAINIESQA